MKYNKFSVYDFLKDESFQKWVKAPNPASDRFWNSWIKEHPEKEEIVTEARKIMLSIRFKSKPASRETEDRILNNIMRKQRPHSLKQRPMYAGRRTFYVAASVLIISAVGAWLYAYNDIFAPPVAIETPVSPTIKESPVGSKISFKLSDGSKIKLNAGSKLHTTNKFGEQAREVFLQGEAFFEVETDTAKPFVIRTGNLTTVVKGTAFNIAAYEDEGDIRVAVTEGNVIVIMKSKNACDTLDLKPSDMVIYNKSTTHFRKVEFDARKELGWKDGIIYFENASCAEIFPYLEKWYGVQIRVKHPEYLAGSFVGEFENESLENVLYAMGNALGFDYQIENKTVHIKPKQNE